MIPEEPGAVRRPLGLAVETVRLVAATEALALPVGLALALVLFRTDAWGRRALIGLLAVAAFVPLPLHATAWLGALGNAGRAQAIGVAPVLVGWPGAAFVHAAAALPWIVLLAGVGLRTVEPGLEEAALLDLPGWRVALRVTLRRGLGAVAAAALAVAVLTAGDMTVTDLLQVRTYAEEAYLQYNLGNGPGAAASVALPPLAVLGLLVGLGARGLLMADPARLPTASARARVWRLGAWRVPLGLAVLAVVGNAVALPLYSLVWRAGRVGGVAASGKPPEWSLAGLLGTLRFAWDEARSPLAQSAALSAAGASVTVVLAWALAWLSRRPGPWRWVTAGSAAVALATPGPVAGMALVFAYRNALALPLWVVALPMLVFLAAALVALGRRLGLTNRATAAAFAIAFVAGVAAPERLGRLSLDLANWVLPSVYDSSMMVVLADVLRTLPYALLVLWPAVRTVPPEFLDGAAVDGLGPWGQVGKVALPMTRSAVVAAWGVAFVLALGELPATNLVTPPGLLPLSVLIWGLLHTGVESHLAGVVLVMLAAVAAAGLFAAFALRRSGRGFVRDNEQGGPGPHPVRPS
jgi:iron(III) transport system permease protein